jgi:hypothetical protein
MTRNDISGYIIELLGGRCKTQGMSKKLGFRVFSGFVYIFFNIFFWLHVGRVRELLFDVAG